MIEESASKVALQKIGTPARPATINSTYSLKFCSLLKNFSAIVFNN